MIDSKIKKWPDFRGILNTSSVKFSEDQVKQIKVTFDTLHEGQLQKGQILESVFDELGFEEDTYENPSDAVNRNTETESRQRAKTLNCDWQHENRLRIKREIKRKAEMKTIRMRESVRKVLVENKTCLVRLKAIFNDLETNMEEIKKHWTKN